MMTEARSRFVYVTYIRTTPEALWKALTTTEFMKSYWFGAEIESEWRAGSAWTMRHTDGSVSDAGEILEIAPPRRLVLKWRHERRPELVAEGEARCTIEVEPYKGAVKLTVTHESGAPASQLIEAVSGGWPRILANLKSLMETGEVILTEK